MILTKMPSGSSPPRGWTTPFLTKPSRTSRGLAAPELSGLGLADDLGAEGLDFSEVGEGAGDLAEV